MYSPRENLGEFCGCWTGSINLASPRDAKWPRFEFMTRSEPAVGVFRKSRRALVPSAERSPPALSNYSRINDAAPRRNRKKKSEGEHTGRKGNGSLSTGCSVTKEQCHTTRWCNAHATGWVCISRLGLRKEHAYTDCRGK